MSFARRLWRVARAVPGATRWWPAPRRAQRAWAHIPALPHRAQRMIWVMLGLAGLGPDVAGRDVRQALHVLASAHWHPSLRLMLWPPRAPRLALVGDVAHAPHDARQVWVLVPYNRPHDPSPSPDVLVMPFQVHPQLSTQFASQVQPQALQDLRGQPRAQAVLFAGGVEAGYDNPTLRAVFHGLPRPGVVAAARQHPAACTVTDAATLNAVLHPTATPAVALVDGAHHRVRQDQWLGTLARSAFFVGAPGVWMPMSHNVVEAMAVGTIPVLNYADWFTPPLEHGVTCLAYDDEASLHAALDAALTMPAEQVAALRANVIAYHDAHLDVGVFVRRALDHPARLLTVRLHVG